MRAPCVTRTTKLYIYIYIYIYIKHEGVKGDFDFRISNLVKNPDRTDV